MDSGFNQMRGMIMRTKQVIMFIAAAALCSYAQLIDYSGGLSSDYSVNTVQDLTYGEGVMIKTADISYDTIDLTLDAYLPEDVSGKTAAVIMLHGGSFMSGTKNNTLMEETAGILSSAGFSCFSINYRLLSEESIPAALGEMSLLDLASGSEIDTAKLEEIAARAGVVDCKSAVRWLRKNSGEYSIDTANIYLFGYSAGAISALGAASTGDRTWTADITGETPLNHPDLSSETHGAVSMSGALFGKEAEFITQESPPFLMWHGTADNEVPYQLAEDIKNHSDSIGHTCILETFDGSGHGVFSEEDSEGRDYTEATYDFLWDYCNIKGEASVEPAYKDGVSPHTTKANISTDKKRLSVSMNTSDFFVELHTLTGKRVFRGYYRQRECSIPIQSLSSGVYSIRIMKGYKDLLTDLIEIK